MTHVIISKFVLIQEGEEILRRINVEEEVDLVCNQLKPKGGKKRKVIAGLKNNKGFERFK